MNPKTDPLSHGQIGRGFLTALAILTILALAVTIGLDHWEPPKGVPRSTASVVTRTGTLFPWIIAAGQTIDNGLLAFSGKTPDVVATSIRTAAVAGLCMTFVIFPTIYLFRWRERRLNESSRSHARPLSVSGLAYGFCEVVTMFFAIAIIPVNIIQQNVRSSVRTGQAIQSNKDIILDEINYIGADLRQYRILPKSLGGGSGSCAGYVLPDKLQKTPYAIFSVQVANDTAIVRAQSVKYPNARAIVTMPYKDFDIGKGHPRWTWEYEGEFL